jgi:hypothetical protein
MMANCKRILVLMLRLSNIGVIDQHNHLELVEMYLLITLSLWVPVITIANRFGLRGL